MSDNDNKIHIDDFTDTISRENNLDKHASKEFIHELFNEISLALINKEDVKIHNFGVFKTKKVSERPGINPQTKEKITIPEHIKTVFKPYSYLSDLVNRKYRSLKPNVLDALLTMTGMTKVNPEFLKELDSDEDTRSLWERAKKRALIILGVITVLFVLILAALITIPVVAINENNRVVQYVNSINKIFGLDKITDKFKGEINPVEADNFYSTAKSKLIENRKVLVEYTVNDGDNIFNIAKKYWNHEYLWPDLFITNKDKIADPDLIRKNEVLTIYEPLGDPSHFTKKQKDDLVYAYLGIYRIYKALGEKDIELGLKERGEKRINDSRWTLYTAVRYDHTLLNRYRDAIYEDDKLKVQEWIDKHGFVPEKK